MRFIRTCIGGFFLWLAGIALPKREESPKETPVKEPAYTEKAIPFTDLQTYIEDLKEPDECNGAGMSICHQVKDISKIRKQVVRLTITHILHFDKEGNQKNTTSSFISAYNAGKWLRVSNLELSVEAVPYLIDEMIEAMAQEGWGCMNDSAEQLLTYLRASMPKNREYVIARCKKLGVPGFLRFDTIFVVDEVNDRPKTAITPTPQIRTSLRVQVNKDEPVETAHFVFFRRKVTQTTPA